MYDYNKKFYDRQRYGSLCSASLIMPFVLNVFPFVKTVTDIGCGVGTWLSVAKMLGKHVLGRDSNTMPAQELLIGEDEFARENFERPEYDGRRFDLCISLEVAEHLHEDSSADFIRFLCAQSDLVMFGAAVPGQLGDNHINPRWQSYWVARFEENGYQCFDLLRKRFWNEPNVQCWYAQNTFIFCRRANAALVRRGLTAAKGSGFLPVDIVHPQIMLYAARNPVPYNYPSEYSEKLASLSRLMHHYLLLRDNEKAKRYLEKIRCNRSQGIEKV
jgi:SAM-dependent methyltransferase